MLVKSWRFRAALCLALFLRIAAEQADENKAYQNVVVSFSSKLSPEDGNHLVESMQKILSDASSVLHTAIGWRIGNVIFHLPQSWNSSAFPDVVPVSSYNTDDEPNIRVKSLTDSAFGKKPVALQYGGCGVPALDISIPNEFLTAEEESYPKGKILAREWLKYRYGVFDENGFLDDPLYPTHYSIPGSDKIHITDCTSPKLDYTFRDFENNSCVLTSETAANCSIRPNVEDLENVKSSLMFYHEELQQLDHVCGKDERNHNVGSLSKQNLLCSYKSIWEVLQLSEDFKPVSASSDAANVGVEYSFVQESELRLVVAWQDTKSLLKQGNTILKVVRKLLYDIPLQSKVGLFNFKGDEWNELVTFAEITENIRDSWATRSNFGSSAEGKPLRAISEAVNVLQADNQETMPGIIVLFTASNPAEDPELVGKLQKSKICLTVIAFPGATKEAWSKFLEISSCSSFLEIPDSDDQVSTYENLHNAVEPIYSSTLMEDFKMHTVSTKLLNHDEVMEIPADPRAKEFTVWIFHDAEFECYVNDAAVNVTNGVRSGALASYIFEAQNDTVKCKLKDIPSGSFLAHVQMTLKEGEYFNNKVWFRDTTPSDSKEQMPYIIYAKIFYGEYPVRDADVRAEVTTPSGQKVILALADDGRGEPDITQYDGIYSKYFTKFDSEGTYKVIVTATDSGKANASRNGQDPCCGSVVVSESFELSKFNWTYETSFDITLKKPTNGYKPSRITDLKVSAMNLPDSITLTWTAPGEEMDEGKANSYVIKSFTSPEDILQNFDNDNISIQVVPEFVPKKHGQIETLVVKLDDFNDNETYFIAMQSKSATQLSSDISNIASIFLPVGKIDEKVTPEPPSKQSGLKTETIGLIVGLVLLAIVIVIATYLVVYFVVLKPKRKEEARSHTASSQRSHPRSTGLNSIPADVILKHHSEVVNAKSLHKDPPIFNEENVEMRQAESSNTSAETENNNRNYAVPSRTFQGDPQKSPKRMTVV